MMFHRRGSSSGRNSNSVFLGLHERIRQLPFREFQQLVLLWLGAKGYREIQSLGRRYRRGRRHSGGAVFLALIPGTDMPVAIQIRHWRTPISSRAVDELWGYLLVHGVATGMIVTNSTFSRRAVERAREYPGRPIRLVSACQLACWLYGAGYGRDYAAQNSDTIGLFRTLRSLQFGWDVSNHRGVGGDQLARRRPHSRQGQVKSALLAILVGIFVLAFILAFVYLWRLVGGIPQ
jgi:hypothetical protein